MSKWLLFIIIIVLSGIIVYLVSDRADEPAEKDSNITVSEPLVESTEEINNPAPARPEPAAGQLAISGVLVRFEEQMDSDGTLFIVAVIDDGTEFIAIDLRQVITPGVSSPEAQLGFGPGNVVTITGRLDNGTFVASRIEVE